MILSEENNCQGEQVNKYLLYGGLILLGVVFAPQLRRLPLLDKLPSV